VSVLRNHAWRPRAGRLGKLGPGEPASLTAFLRKAGLIECRSGAGGLCKIAHNWDIFAEEPGVKASAQGFTLADLVRGRGLSAPAGIAGARLRSTSTHGHPGIRCTQTAMPTAITKNSGSATAKSTAFASISAPAFPSQARVNVTASSFEQWMRSGCGATLASASAALDRAAGQLAGNAAMSVPRWLRAC
jgi:hypothetical protein